MVKLDGQVAAVTGASSGMGRAACKLFAQEGAKVVGMARREEMLATLPVDGGFLAY